MITEYYENIQLAVVETGLLCHDALIKNLYYTNQAQELLNSAWGWHGANLEVEHND